MANGDEKSLDHSHSTNPIDGQEVSPTDYPPEVGDLTHDDMQGVAGAAGEAWSSFCVVAAGRPLPSTCASVQTSLRTLQARVTAALAKMPTAETDTVSVAAVSGTAGVAAATAVAADATQEMPGGSQKVSLSIHSLSFGMPSLRLVLSSFDVFVQLKQMLSCLACNRKMSLVFPCFGSRIRSLMVGCTVSA